MLSFVPRTALHTCGDCNVGDQSGNRFIIVNYTFFFPALIYVCFATCRSLHEEVTLTSGNDISDNDVARYYQRPVIQSLCCRVASFRRRFIRQSCSQSKNCWVQLRRAGETWAFVTEPLKDLPQRTRGPEEPWRDSQKIF